MTLDKTAGGGLCPLPADRLESKMGVHNTDVSQEAATNIQALLSNGYTMAGIANELGVTLRSIYRWQREGTTPHRMILSRLREMAAQPARGETNDARQYGDNESESGGIR